MVHEHHKVHIYGPLDLLLLMRLSTLGCGSCLGDQGQGQPLEATKYCRMHREMHKAAKRVRPRIVEAVERFVRYWSGPRASDIVPFVVLATDGSSRLQYATVLYRLPE